MHDLRGFGDLDWEGWFVLVTVGLSFVVMIGDFCTPPLTMLAEITIFMLLGIITPRQAFAGFSSTGLWIVAVMLVVAQGLAGTGGLDYLMSKVLGKPSDITLAQIRIMLATAVLSSFISGTPVTAMMIPITVAFAQKARLPQKQLLIAMVFASQTGGTNTVLGTSSNLAIIGQMELRWADPSSIYYREDFKSPSVFALTPFGIPGTLFIVVFVTLLSPMFLVQGEGWSKWINYFRFNQVSDLWKKSRQFDVTLVVADDSPVVNMTMEASGLMDMSVIAPVALTRSGDVKEPTYGDDVLVKGDSVIQAGDHITFAGDLVKLPELVLGFNLQPVDDAMLTSIGLVFAEDDMGIDVDGKKMAHKSAVTEIPPSLINLGPPRLFTAGVSANSNFLGHRIAEINFPENFSLSILSVRRNKESLEGSIGDIQLAAGDEVLFDVGPTFWRFNPETTAELDTITKVPQTAPVKEYIVGFEVKGMLAKPLLVGLTVSNAGLKAVVEGFLVGLQRGVSFYNAVADEEVLQFGDILWFSGTAKCMALLRKTPGLELLAREIQALGKDPLLDRQLFEASVATHSPLVGKTAEEVAFTATMEAALLGVRRQGLRVVGYPTTIVLQAGDTLLVEAGDTFANIKSDDNPCFSTVRAVPDTTPPKLLWVLVALGLYIPCFIAFAVFSWRAVIVMMSTCVMLMLMTRCLSPRQAWKAVHWDIIMCIGAALAISAAMENTGGAEAIAKALTSLGGDDPGLMIAIMYLTTALLSQLIMNTAAAMIIFPVAANVADAMDIDIYAMSFAVMIGANAVYTMPFADTSILMTFGAGGYRSVDWVRFGIFIQIGMAVTTSATLILGAKDKVYIAWIYSWIIFGVVVALPHIFAIINWRRNIAVTRRREQLRNERLEKMEVEAAKKSVYGGHLSFAVPGGAATGYTHVGHDEN